jgi:hypothetical protein
MKCLLPLCLLAPVAAFVVFAQYVDPIELDVAAGTTNTLAQAIAAYNAENSTSYSVSSFNGGDLKTWTIVKLGDGTLKMDADLQNYEGAIEIEQGSLWCTARYGLGKKDDPDQGTHVHTGATLVNDASAFTAVYNGTEYIRYDGGEGFGGNAQLVARNMGSKQNFWSCGTNSTLNGDTVFSLSQSRSGDYCTGVGYGGTLNLAGNTLVVDRAADSPAAPYFKIGPGGRLVNNGTLIASNINFHVYYTPQIIRAEHEDSSIIFGGTCDLFLAIVQSYYSRTEWKLVFRNTAGGVCYGGGGYGDYSQLRYGNGWDGPVEIETFFRPYRQSTVTDMRQYSAALRGVVSGPGSITKHTGTIAGRNCGLNIHLTNPENSFQGGIFLDRGSVFAHCNGAVPADGGDVNLTCGGKLVLCSPWDVYDLPGATLNSTNATLPVVVQFGEGRWRKAVTKTGAGPLHYYSAVGGPLLDVKEGMVRFAKRKPGLYGGYHDPNGENNDTNYSSKNMNAGNVITNELVLVPEVLDIGKPSNDGTLGSFFRSKCLASYAGYMWNDGEEQDWTFAMMFMQGFRLDFGESNKVIYAAFGSLQGNYPNKGTVTVPHGASRFRAWARCANAGWMGPMTYTNGMYRSGTTTGAGRAPEGEDWDWHGEDRQMSFGLDRLGRDSFSSDDYAKVPTDPGDGSIFSLTTNEQENAAFVPAFDMIAFADGTSLDLNGHTYSINDFTGMPTVVGGNLVVTGTWSVAKADVLAGRWMDVDGSVAFGDGACIEVNDLGSIQKAGHDGDGAFTLVKATGGVTGTPRISSNDETAAKRWKFTVDQTGNLRLAFAPSGFYMTLR